MIEKITINKIWKIILKRKSLRVLGFLSVIFILLTIASVVADNSYKNKNVANKNEIQQTKDTLVNLQLLAAAEEEGLIDDKLSQIKLFAEYEEVIPFITYLESLFTMIDPEAELTIKSQEKQIFIDHFADYKIILKIGAKKDLFFMALDELYNSRYITKLINFTMNYKRDEDYTNQFTNAEITIRLYLK